ncbi:MAG: hypothetical protein R2764_05395 [Bacteroidales bacterium]
MKKCIFYIIVFIVTTNSTIFSQNKYAVLIIGDEATNEQGQMRQLNTNGNENLVFSPWGYGDEKWDAPRPCFWYDAVRMYKALLQVGYTDENIFLLFGRGFDYETTTFPMAHYYDPEPNITDFPARVQDVENIFEWLKVGNMSLGIPALTDDDFLFVWTFGHGGYEDLNNNGLCDEDDEVFICLMDENF